MRQGSGGAGRPAGGRGGRDGELRPGASRPTLQDWLEHICIVGFVIAVRLLPAAVSVWLAGFLGKVAFDLVGFRRRVTLSNLRERLAGGRSTREFEEIGRASYMHFGMGIAEFVRVPQVDRSYVERYIRLDGLEHLDRALEDGKGAVLVTGHFGSWELMGRALVLAGYPMNFIVGVQRNPLVQDMMNDIRRSAGVGVVEPDSLLKITRRLRSNGFVAMLSDQDAGPHGAFVDFFGEKASTPQGAARLALMTGAPVIPGFIIRLGGLRHHVVIEKPVEIPAGMDREEAVMRITRAFTGVIEKYAGEHPDHYLWAHRRWKTRPPAPDRG
jgi:KDO2-lipid IV(A) lauroyltransferase